MDEIIEGLATTVMILHEINDSLRDNDFGYASTTIDNAIGLLNQALAELNA